MAIRVDTHVVRIDLAAGENPEQAIKQECDIQASRDEGRRLAAAFTVENQLILIFQIAPDNP